MTQVGEGPEADARPVMTFGAPAAGEVLADRYRLEEHINDDAVGRQVWRGVDVVLRRAVAVILRYPGGESAEEMLKAAVAASRVAHSNLVGVYDAIDEGERAYVVREWVDGAALRDYVAQNPLDSPRATTIGHAIASAVAAVHATGMVHGNIHPGTVLIGSEGRVVLADARANGRASVEGDIRAIGAILYFSLTGHWPHAEAGRQSLPDAVRDTAGAIVPPRQIRAAVPSDLDELITDLLDSGKPLPATDVLAAELGRLDAEAEAEATMDGAYYDDGPLSFGSGTVAAEAPRPGGRKVALGMIALLLVAVIGVLIATRLLTLPGTGGNQASPGTSTRPTQSGAPSAAAEEVPIQLSASQVRIVDPEGDRTELDGVAEMVDGDQNTGWKTDRYNNRANFGGTKKGMGVLLDLGEPRPAEIEVVLSTTGASADLRVGDADGGSNKTSDERIVSTYRTVGPSYAEHHGIRMVFTVDAENAARYVMIWFTLLPQVQESPPRFQIGVQEITVRPSR